MKKLLRATIAALLLGTTLAGCIMVPVGGGPGYHHRHHGYYR